MRHRSSGTRRLLLVVLLLVGSAACQPPREDPASIERIILIGDSLAWGIFEIPGLDGYLSEFYPNAEIVQLGGPAGSPGDNWDGGEWSNWSSELNHWLSYGFDADLVIIQSCCDRGETAAWRGGLDATIAKARLHDPGEDRRVIVVANARIVPGTAPYYEHYNTHNEIIRANDYIRQIPNIAVADVDAAWSVNGQPVWNVPGVGVARYLDGLHYSEAGARDAARIVSLT